jgi:hypothetical protein
MASSLLSHKQTLQASINFYDEPNPEYVWIAGGRQHADVSAADDTGMDFEAEDAVPDELIVPPELAHEGKCTTAYAAIKTSTFWSQLEQYVQLNELVAESIPILGGDLAALSDAAVAMLQLNDSVLTLTEGLYPDFLDAVDISLIQKLWKGRFESFL